MSKHIEPASSEILGSTKGACSIAMRRIIEASRYDKADICAYTGLSLAALNTKTSGARRFTLDEAVLICKLVDISLDEALSYGSMSKEEFSNAWIYKWRRQNFMKIVTNMEVREKKTRTEIAEKCGFTKTWLSQISNGKNKIVDRTARQIEHALDLSEGWLDRKPSAPQSAASVNIDAFIKVSKMLQAAAKEEKLELETDILNAYTVALAQLYNVHISSKEDPEADAVDFARVFDQFIMALKMNDGLWKH